MRHSEPVSGRPRETALVLAVAEAETVVADFSRSLLEEHPDGTWTQRTRLSLGGGP